MIPCLSPLYWSQNTLWLRIPLCLPWVLYSSSIKTLCQRSAVDTLWHFGIVGFASVKAAVAGWVWWTWEVKHRLWFVVQCSKHWMQETTLPCAISAIFSLGCDAVGDMQKCICWHSTSLPSIWVCWVYLKENIRWMKTDERCKGLKLLETVNFKLFFIFKLHFFIF